MTLIELRDAMNKDIEAGMGGFTVVFGDCNQLHKVTGYGRALVEDIDVHYLEELHPDSEEGVPVYAIGE